MQNRFYNDKPFASVTDWSPRSRWIYRQQQRYNVGHYDHHYSDAAAQDEEEQGSKLNRLEERVPCTERFFVLFSTLSASCSSPPRRISIVQHRRKLINPGFGIVAFIHSQLWPHPIYGHPIYPFVWFLFLTKCCRCLYLISSTVRLGRPVSFFEILRSFARPLPRPCIPSTNQLTRYYGSVLFTYLSAAHLRYSCPVNCFISHAFFRFQL